MKHSRHTFASDMVRAGVSLPALMQLMGHAHIQTTMVYVQVTPLEIYQQYARPLSKHIRPVPGTPAVKISPGTLRLNIHWLTSSDEPVESLTAALSPDSHVSTVARRATS